jgi:hypothetical protein
MGGVLIARREIHAPQCSSLPFSSHQSDTPVASPAAAPAAAAGNLTVLLLLPPHPACIAGLPEGAEQAGTRQAARRGAARGERQEVPALQAGPARRPVLQVQDEPGWALLLLQDVSRLGVPGSMGRQDEFWATGFASGSMDIIGLFGVAEGIGVAVGRGRRQRAGPVGWLTVGVVRREVRAVRECEPLARTLGGPRTHCECLAACLCDH